MMIWMYQDSVSYLPNHCIPTNFNRGCAWHHPTLTMGMWPELELTLHGPAHGLSQQGAWVFFLHTQALKKHPSGHPNFSLRNFLTLMLLVATLANTKWCKNPEKWSKTWQMVLIWECSARAFKWIPTWQGLNGFSKNFASLCLGWK